MLLFLNTVNSGESKKKKIYTYIPAVISHWKLQKGNNLRVSFTANLPFTILPKRKNNFEERGKELTHFNI